MILILSKLVLAILLAAAFIVVGIFGNPLDTQKDWQKAPATIIAATIEHVHPDGPQIKLIVTYVANGQPFTTTTYSNEFDSESNGVVRRVTTGTIPQHLAVNRSIPIFFNQQSPTHIRLSNESSQMYSWLLIFVGALTLLIASSTSGLDLFIKYQQWKMNYYLNKAKHDFDAGFALLTEEQQQLINQQGSVPRKKRDRILVDFVRSLRKRKKEATKEADTLNKKLDS